MNYLEWAVFAAFPYAAIAVAVVGCLMRLRTMPLSWKSGSSQLLESRALRWGTGQCNGKHHSQSLRCARSVSNCRHVEPRPDQFRQKQAIARCGRNSLELVAKRSTDYGFARGVAAG